MATQTQNNTSPIGLSREDMTKMGMTKEQIDYVLSQHTETVRAAVAAVPKGKRDSTVVATLRAKHDRQRLIAQIARCIASDTDVEIAYQSDVASRKRATNNKVLGEQASELGVSNETVNKLRKAIADLASTF